MGELGSIGRILLIIPVGQMKENARQFVAYIF